MILRILLSIVLALLLFSCTQNNEVIQPQNREPGRFSAEVQPILTRSCGGSDCHGGGPRGFAGGLDLTSYDAIFRGSRYGTVVVSGSPFMSHLVQCINQTDTNISPISSMRMPASRDLLHPQDIQTIVRWIGDGAPNDEGSLPFPEPRPLGKLFFTVRQAYRLAYKSSRRAVLLMTKINFNRARALVVVAFAILTTATHAETLTGRVVGIADGDTLTLLDGSDVQHKIRLDGIDAPERGQPFGDLSKQSLSDLAFNKDTQARCPKFERYGRRICQVTVVGVDVGLEQIRRGMAWHFKRYESEQSEPDRAAYVAAEAEARRAKRGLWADAVSRVARCPRGRGDGDRQRPWRQDGGEIEGATRCRLRVRRADAVGLTRLARRRQPRARFGNAPKRLAKGAWGRSAIPWKPAPMLALDRHPFRQKPLPARAAQYSAPALAVLLPGTPSHALSQRRFRRRPISSDSSGGLPAVVPRSRRGPSLPGWAIAAADLA